MSWYVCPLCKKKLRRTKRDMLVNGGKSFCGKSGRAAKLKPVKPA